MEQLETFVVECPDAVGAKTTRTLIQDTLADLSLNRVIGRLKVFVDPVEPVFIFTALLRLGTPAIRLKDFAKVEMGALGKDEVKIELLREAFTVKLLNKLWEKYGNLQEWKNNVGTGAFMIDDFVPGAQLSLIKNQNLLKATT